jgi:two-component system OmpR family response regulator
MRVLLIEDEPVLGQAVQEQVAADGHAVDWVTRLDEADAALRAVDYGLVLLDLHLPDGRGLDLLKTLRRGGDRRPVIILTARDQISDRIEGLNAGADDYLVKPFDLDELSARVRAVLRRRAGRTDAVMKLGALEIDTAARRVRWKGKDAALSAREYALLEALADRPGAYLSRAQLEERLYGWDEEIASNAVEVHIHGLRRKLDPDLIRNVRGLGYTLATS